MEQKTNYKEGDLVRWVSFMNHVPCRGGASGVNRIHGRYRCITVSPYCEITNNKSFEGKLGLIVKVFENRLGQCIAYGVKTDNDEWFCRFVEAHRYLELAGEQPNDLNRRTGQV